MLLPLCKVVQEGKIELPKQRTNEEKEIISGY
jgi:hypothetical protein